MTPEEYADAVEEAIEDRDAMRVWEIYDLRLLVRLARQRGFVYKTDLLFLNIAGIPIRGQLIRPAKKFEVPRIAGKQQGLFG